MGELMGKKIFQRIGGMRSPFAVYLFLVFLACIVMVGCGGPRTYIHPNPGLDMVKKVVVMPFDNLSADASANQKVRISFVIELLRTGNFDVLDIGEADRRLGASGLSYSAARGPIPITAPRGGSASGAGSAGSGEGDTSVPLSRQIGGALGVQALLLGSVDTYSLERTRDESIPEVTVTARLVDVETGVIIWASTHTRRGRAGIPILGWGKRTSLGLVSRKVIADMAEDLAQYVPEQ